MPIFVILKCDIHVPFIQDDVRQTITVLLHFLMVSQNKLPAESFHYQNFKTSDFVLVLELTDL